MHNAISAAKRDAMEARRELGTHYLESHPTEFTIPFEKAVAQRDLEEETRAARVEAAMLSQGKDSQHDSGSLQYPVLAHDFAVDSEAIRLGTSPLILSPVIQYFGMVPVLFNMFVTRAYQNELNANSAHMFHMDPEDVISFKVFIHLTEVDDDCGPFHALPADLTQKVLKAVDYRGIGWVADEKVAEVAGWDTIKKFTGSPGTVALADTTRCLHFGGRPRKPGKPIRDMLVYQYLLPTSLLFPVAGDSKHPRFLPQLEPTGDTQWDALIGATLT